MAASVESACLRIRPIASNAGLFISRGEGIHPDRVIDSFELIFVRSGVLAMEEAGIVFRVAPGQSLLLYPGRRHRGIEAYDADLSFYWIHFHLPATSRRAIRNVPQQHAIRRPDRLMELYHRFLDDQQNGRLTPMAADALVTLMLCEAVDELPADDADSAARRLAGRAEALIASRAHESISAASIAEALGCNPDYLGRVFRRTFGHTLTDAIHRQRCRDARKLLLDGANNVDQVARRVGFQSSGYFRRVFKHAEGITPRKFGQLYQRTHINWR